MHLATNLEAATVRFGDRPAVVDAATPLTIAAFLSCHGGAKPPQDGMA